MCWIFFPFISVQSKYLYDWFLRVLIQVIEMRTRNVYHYCQQKQRIYLYMGKGLAYEGLLRSHKRLLTKLYVSRMAYWSPVDKPITTRL